MAGGHAHLKQLCTCDIAHRPEHGRETVAMEAEVSGFAIGCCTLLNTFEEAR